METFKEILFDLMLENELTIPQLSKKVNIVHSNFYDYKNHNTLPNVEFAFRLAKFFHCSINFLMGLTDNCKDISLKESYDTSLFFPRYNNLLKTHNITNHKFCKISGVNDSSYNLWEKGSIPKMETLIKIADYFNCSIDYLIGYSDEN